MHKNQLISDLICIFAQTIQKYMKNSIRLNNMKCYAFHGVMEHERRIGNTFIVNLELFTDLSKASETDDLSETINYAETYNIVKAEMEIPSKLLEHVAGRILRKIKKEFPAIEKLEICLAKQNPPVGGKVESASVSLSLDSSLRSE